MSNLFQGEAKIHFGDADFTILETGNFINCAVTGDPIPLNQLRYWSAERQEAYKDASASLAAWKKAQSA
jgi:hypothetical protein